MTTGESLSVVIGAQVDPLIQGLKQAEAALNSFGKNTQIIMDEVGHAAGLVNDLFGIGLTAGLAYFTKNTIENTAALGYQAQQLGLNVEKFQELKFAAEQSGVSGDDFVTGLDRLARSLGEAQSGVQKSQDIFAKWGISIRDASGQALSLDQVLSEVSNRFASITDAQLRIAAANDLMGRGSVSMINFLSQGSNAMADATQKAREMGAVIGSDVVKQMQEAEEKIKAASAVINVNLTEALVNVVPLLEKVSSAVKDLSGFFSDAEHGASLLYNMWTNQIVSLSKGGGDPVKTFYDTMQQMDKENPGLLTPVSKSSDAANAITAATPSSNNSGFHPGNPEATRALNDYLLKLQQLHDANQLNARDQAIQAAVDQAESIARSQGVTATQAYIDKVKDAAAANYDLTQQLQAVKEISNSLTSDLLNQFQEMTQGTETFGQAIQKLGLDFVDLLEKMIVEKPLENSLQSLFGAAGGLTGLLGGASDSFDSLFGTGKYATQYDSPIGPTLQGFATGGSPPVGVPSIVGEQGPELFVPDTAGTIVPNSALGNGGGLQLTQHVHFSATDPAAIRAQVMNMLPQIAGASKAAVADAVKRGGKYAKAISAA